MIEHINNIIALLSKGWIQGTFARDADGNRVSEYSPKACQFCLVGALNHCCDDLRIRGRVRDDLDRILYTKWPHRASFNPCILFNDSDVTTLEEILGALQELKGSYE